LPINNWPFFASLSWGQICERYEIRLQCGHGGSNGNAAGERCYPCQLCWPMETANERCARRFESDDRSIPDSIQPRFRFDANGDVPFLRRAIAIRQNYGCAKSNDSIYLALTEHLMTDGVAEMVTFDVRLANQAKANAPNVKVNLLTI
jgi:hypothetical protein